MHFRKAGQLRFALWSVDPIEPIFVAGDRAGMQQRRSFAAIQRRRRRPQPIFSATYEIRPQNVSLNIAQGAQRGAFYFNFWIRGTTARSKTRFQA